MLNGKQFVLLHSWEHRTPRQDLSPILLRRLTYTLGRVAAAAGRQANAKLADLGIDTRLYSALTVISEQRDPSQQAVAKALGADRATVVALVDELEQRGLVRRLSNPSDRRAHALRATPAGRRLLGRADALMDECERSFVSALDADEQAALATMLAALFESSGSAE